MGGVPLRRGGAPVHVLVDAAWVLPVVRQAQQHLHAWFNTAEHSEHGAFATSGYIDLPCPAGKPTLSSCKVTEVPSARHVTCAISIMREHMQHLTIRLCLGNHKIKADEGAVIHIPWSCLHTDMQAVIQCKVQLVQLTEPLCSIVLTVLLPHIGTAICSLPESGTLLMWRGQTPALQQPTVLIGRFTSAAPVMLYK